MKRAKAAAIDDHTLDDKLSYHQGKWRLAHWLLPLTLAISNPLIANDTEAPYSTNNQYADVIVRVNPAGIMVMAGANYQQVRRVDPQYNIPANALKLGGEIGINPAYGQLSLYTQWLPLIFLNLRLQYDYYTFFGKHGGLLSFDSADQPFDDKTIENREGDEESTSGDRLLFKPLLRAKIGNVVLQNQTTLAHYQFNGKGPFFLEWEYDTLLKDGDTLSANDFSLLYKFNLDNKAVNFYAGPYHEWVHAEAANLTRQRLGIKIFWSSKTGKRPSAQRFYTQVGINLEDRNREGNGFALIGYGLDF